MPLTTAARMLLDCTQANVDCGPFGYPEVPNLAWGNNNGGYMLDYNAGYWLNRGYTRTAPSIKSGGWQSNERQVYNLTWWQLINTYKSPLTNKNPARERMWLQVRWQRRYYNRIENNAWDLQAETKDPRAGSEHFFGDSLTFDAKALGATTYTRNNVTYPVVGPGKASVTAPSGGAYYRGSRDWVVHGYPLGHYAPNFGIYQAVGTTVQFRLVPGGDTPAPGTLTADFDWENFDAGFSTGLDWYWLPQGSQTDGPCCFSRLIRPTNRWQVVSAATVRENRFVRNKAPGWTEAQFLANPLPIPFEEEVWIERGAYNSTTDKQTLVLKRSAPAPANKTYYLTVARGTATGVPASVVMGAGVSSVQFDVTTPDSLPTSQQCLYVTDGASEDHWATYVFGTGTATGSASGGVGSGTAPTRTNVILRTGAMQAAPWSLSGGSAGTADANGWQLITNPTSDYIKQECAGLGADEPATITLEVKPGTAAWLLLRQVDSGNAHGCHQFINLTSGAAGAGTTHGTVSGLSVAAVEIPNDGQGVRVKITLTMAATARNVMMRGVASDGDWGLNSSLTFYCRKQQMQKGSKGTRHIPTTSAAVTRTLAAVEVSADVSIPLGPAVAAAILLKDDQGQPFDQYGPVLVSSSAVGVLGVSQPSGETDENGSIAFTITPVSEGVADITASSGAVDSAAKEVTIGEADTDLSTPAAPVVTPTTTGSVLVNVGSIDADATHVEITLRHANYIPGDDDQLPGAPGAPSTVTVAKGSIPLTISDLRVGVAYIFSAKATTATASSAASPETTATLPGLRVRCRASADAAGASGVSGVVWIEPDEGDVVGAELIQFSGLAFEASTEVDLVDGKTVAVLYVDLSAVADLNGVADGDTVYAVARSSTKGTWLMQDAKIEEV